MKRGYIMALANIARLNARVAGMQAENEYRMNCGNQSYSKTKEANLRRCPRQGEDMNCQKCEALGHAGAMCSECATWAAEWRDREITLLKEVVAKADELRHILYCATQEGLNLGLHMHTVLSYDASRAKMGVKP